MNKDELEIDCELGLSTHKLALKYQVSQTNIRYWLKKFKLKTQFHERIQGFHCNICGVSLPDKFFKSRTTTCKECHNKNVIKRGREKKKEAVRYKGGKCEECGYNECTAALDFHHIDPSTKDHNFGSFRGWSDKRIKVELDKCILLCANCHRKLHYIIDKEN